jgi:hypothetical protein
MNIHPCSVQFLCFPSEPRAPFPVNINEGQLHPNELKNPAARKIKGKNGVGLR